jgi:hypothetical protein
VNKKVTKSPQAQEKWRKKEKSQASQKNSYLKTVVRDQEKKDPVGQMPNESNIDALCLQKIDLENGYP